MSSKTDKQRNRLMHLEDTLVMYRVYSVETLEKLIKTVHALHSRQSMYECLFTGQMTKAYEYYLQMHGDHCIQYYSINSILYLRKIKDKYIEMYNEFISKLHNYAKVIRILAKGYLLIGLSFLFIEMKELCEARAKLEMSSNLADEPTLADVLPPIRNCLMKK